MLKVLKIVVAAGGFLVSAAFAFQEAPVAENSPKKIGVVVIDAGHGGHDTGTRGKVARESHIALKIALALGKKIKAAMPEVRVLYTRTSDVFVELAERSAFANRNQADLFISIHCNYAPGSSRVTGTETFVMGLHKSEGNLQVAKRENSVILKEDNYKQRYKGFDPESPLAHIMLANYQSAFLSSSLRFAGHVEKQFHDQRPSRGVKQAGFLVLWRATMPSVLIETGFLSNATEEAYLNSADGQEEVSQSIFKAFNQYKKEMERY
ncbi:hypothetical protein GCM10027275_29190 [Rhabdobacter roseus]|uniref:N-acetylmuramoyl-L-alanine amidase n=1 Tax=Rhabdobacter roseus TaxID=1655419 RepID=A0A840TYA6_9BACT|nr:N-acetylmuramoyl-L-alanine amidase [Rhabdobacter roseus]MBB5284870.1 N-acetylmuramoyl-L-alanine amidase [Rhabdobacter roseus]